MVHHRGFQIAVVSVAFAGLIAAPLHAASDTKSAGARAGKAQASEAPKPAAASRADSAQTTVAPPGIPPVAPGVAVVPLASATPFTLEGTDLGRMLHRDENALPTRNRDGSMKLDLQGGYRNVLVVRIMPDGKPEISCVATEEQAKAALAPVQEIPTVIVPLSADPAVDKKKTAKSKEKQ